MYYLKHDYAGKISYTVHDTEAPSQQAEMAERLMRQLAIAALMPDGEDTSGRQKFRLMTPLEVVERATTIAAHAWENFQDRGWILDVPEIKQTNETSQPK